MINVLVYAIQIAYLCRVLFGLCCFYSHIIRTVLTEMKDSNNQNTRKEKNMKNLSLLMAGLLLTAGMFAQTVTKTVNELQSANNWTISEGNNIGTMATEFALDEVITISTTGEPNCGSVWNSKNDVMDWRIYQAKSGNIIITAADGYVMTSVTLVYGNSNNGVLLDGDKNVVASDTEYALDKVSEVTFVVGKSKEDGKTNGQARVISFTITYEKNGDVTIAKPTFAPETTEFEDKIEVTITTSKSNVIYYTLDGTTPTTSSTLYSGPITLTETTTVKAIAYNEVEKAASGIASQTYTKKEAAKVNTIAEANAMSKGAEVILEGQIVALAADGAVLQDATGLIYCYKNVNDLKLGDKVRATATLSEYGGAKQLTEATYQVLGTDKVSYPKAETWTATEMDEWIGAAYREKKYITVEATLKINNNKYYNLTVEGATNKASIVKPLEDVSAMDGSVIVVTGYAMYAATSSGTTYAYIVATGIEEKMPQQVETFANLNALVAADLTSGTSVKVTIKDVAIKKIYAKKNGERVGIYFDVQKEDKDIEIFFQNEEMPKDWIEGGLLSGTITGSWERYEYNKEFRNWELIPESSWHWTNLTYSAGTTPLSEATADKKARKVVENGVIYIIRNGVRYNVFGGQTE